MAKSERTKKNYANFLEAPLSKVDSGINLLINLEENRQNQKIILIPSESICPRPVRETLASCFTNLYAEGYPAPRISEENDEKTLLDVDYQLAHYRRYSDRRFYKGVEFADFVESLAQRRVAKCFATEKVSPDHIFVNVQPLSGAAANNSVYTAFLEPGDTIMGMHLSHGGHLTHGSKFNRSGKYYHTISYEADPETGKLNYEAIRELALQHQPKMIIAGYSAYPWRVEWKKFKDIADSVEALLLADIAHVAGMVTAGVYPNPVGLADVITFTTHKTLCGPRGAVILTTDRKKAELIDNAVFPGEQGGPHINTIAAIATCFKIAETKEFQKLQEKIVQNAKILASSLEKRGLTPAYGGTDTHLLLIDLNAIDSKTGIPLKGEMAARILDLCDIVVNKNTLPGDKDAAEASGIRLGTPWITQRGFGEQDMKKLAQLIHKVLVHIRPFTYKGADRELPRGKIELDIIEQVKKEINELIQRKEIGQKKEKVPKFVSSCQKFNLLEEQDKTTIGFLRIKGERAKPFLQEICTANLIHLKTQEVSSSFLLDSKGELLDVVSVLHLPCDAQGKDQYLLASTQVERLKTWLQGLSDGYIIFDLEDIFAKIQGPVVVEKLAGYQENTDHKLEKNLYISFDKLKEHLGQGLKIDVLGLHDKFPSFFDLSKPYFIGQNLFIRKKVPTQKKKERFSYRGEEKIRKSFLYGEHQKLEAKFTRFAGFRMPLYYTSIAEEYRAVRETVGLFDVTHMGIIEIEGENACDFVDAVSTNYARWIHPGQSQYSFLLNPEGEVIDDIIIYCQSNRKYMIICNANNQGKVFYWLQAVHSKKYLIDEEYPVRKIKTLVSIRNLKDPSEGKKQKIDITLQGPNSFCVLEKLAKDEVLQSKIRSLEKNAFIKEKLAGKDIIISHTGYAGEKMGFELYLHPKDGPFIWSLIIKEGQKLGLKPCGLGARDATRVEAGLPLHGHELAGKYKIDPVAAGYGHFVKFHKPFFVGRKILLEKEKKRQKGKKIIRFKLKSSFSRMIRREDPVVDKKGKDVGIVTSCVLAGDSQIGLAYIDARIEEGEKITIFPVLHGKIKEKPAQNLSENSKKILSQEAIVLPRFPEEK